MSPLPPLTPLTLDDVPALTALINAIDAHEDFGEPAEEPSIREWLGMPGLDLASDSWALREGEELVAFGLVDVSTEADREGRVRANLMGGIHPDRRRRGLGTALLERLESRATELVAERHPGRPAVARVPGGLDPRTAGEGPGGIDVRPLLEGRGYRRARSWLEMLRPLPGDALPAAPEAARVLATEDGHGEAVRRAHNAAFADHWGSTAMPADRWQAWWTSHTVRRDLGSVAVDEEGTVLAYAMVSEDVPGQAHIALVGTRPEARGQGLARAVLARTLRAAAETGCATAKLEVDATSITGAARLYEGLGFREEQVSATYEKPIA